MIHKHENDWCLPFPGSDAAVVYRSQHYFYDRYQQRPVQFKAYVAFPGVLQALLTAFAAVAIFLMSKLSCTANLMLRYPRVFSFGMVTKEGPSERVMEGTHFSFTLYGEGWEAGSDVETTPPNKKLVAKVCTSFICTCLLPY